MINKNDGKIPAGSEKVFSGIRSEVYQWDQQMYDESYSRFERIRFSDGAFVLPILSNGDILLTEQEQPGRDHSFISLPGGGFDFPEEDSLDCAKRELFEETGYVSDNWDLWFVSTGTANIISYTYFYIAYDSRRITEPRLDPGEKIRLHPMSFDEFLLLSENPRFINWPLSKELFMARLYPDAYNRLKQKFRI